MITTCQCIVGLWDTSNCFPCSASEPPSGKGYVATRPTRGLLVIVSPAVKLCGTSRQQGLCSQPAPLWANSNFAHLFEVLGTPRQQGLCSYPAPFLATSDSFPRFEVFRTAQAAGVV